MEKKFITKISACKPIDDSNSRFSERVIDVHFIPSCDNDNVTLDEVTAYWANHVFRSKDYPPRCHYRVDTSYTRRSSRSVAYIFKTK